MDQGHTPSNSAGGACNQVSAEVADRNPLQELAQAARESLGAAAGTILLLEPAPGMSILSRAAADGFERAADPKPDASGRIAELGHPWLIEDVGRQREGSLLDVQTGSEAGAPIILEGRVAGALMVYSERAGDLTRTGLKTLEALARCTSLLLANATLREQVNRQKGELEAVLGIGREILSTLELEEVLQRVAKQGARLLNGRVCVLLLIDRLSDQLTLRASFGLTSKSHRPLTVPATGSLLGQVVRSGQPLAIGDLRRSREHHLKGLARSERLRSLVAAPLRSKREVTGVLAVYSSELRTFGKEDLRMATLLATQSAIAIENARLYHEARSTQAALRQSEKLAALGRLSAGLAHEMRNPLNTLNVLVYAMAERPAKALKADLEVVKREVDRLRLLLDQFLDFARPRQPRFARERLEEIVEETLLLVRPEADKRGIAILRETPPSMPAAWADGMQIRQVLLNVLLNAMQALERGGTIKIVLREAPDGLVVIVEDSGPGIAPEIRERLFDPFFSTRKGGLGLGLSISQRILEAHSGSLEIESEPRAGTRVSIKLPR